VCIFDNAELFRQFVDLLPFGAYIADPHHKFLYWNRRAENITGFLAQEVVGERV
jgi:PAS domain S-box-containing protein